MQNDDAQSAPELVPDAAALTSLNTTEFALAEADSAPHDSKDLVRALSLWLPSIISPESRPEDDDASL